MFIQSHSSSFIVKDIHGGNRYSPPAMIWVFVSDIYLVFLFQVKGSNYYSVIQHHTVNVLFILIILLFASLSTKVPNIDTYEIDGKLWWPVFFRSNDSKGIDHFHWKTTVTCLRFVYTLKIHKQK